MTDAPKKSEIKTVDFDDKRVHSLLTVAALLVDFPRHAALREACDRQIRKIEQDVETALEKVHEDEAKEKAEAEAKKAAAKPADETKTYETADATTPSPAADTKGGKK